ncbi:MliC family protein [Pseudomonas cucumis]|uniref:MliC family protein n=1 Tax=Pseudomonas cucumis TaxID=2954082 RepID=A0ABY9F862_9PSED|nr:MliC family protein [Pseudomonas cucumis]WLG87598.1 MliC family protein [Pseudomonas cucumis]
MKTVTALFTSLLAASLCAATSTCTNAEPVSPIIQTSFDCATARASVEKLICRDPQLTQMDIELTRLYRLALTDDHSVPRPDKVMIDQQFWIDARNQCASTSEVKACTIRSYAERAHQLRQGSAIARTKDPDRLTEGPLAFRCTGLNALLAATFFNTQPGVVYLKWANSSITLNQVQNDSGTQYTGKDSQGNYSFWQDGNGVLFQKPGSGEMSCTAEPIG